MVNILGSACDDLMTSALINWLKKQQCNALNKQGDLLSKKSGLVFKGRA
jgi:hypothetical protein